MKYQFYLHSLIEKSLEKNNTGPLKIKLLHYLANSYNNIGIIYGDKDQIDSEIKYYHKSLNIYEQLNNAQGIADVYNNLGYAYSIKGEIDKALSYHYKSLKIVKKINDKKGQSLSYNNIGVLLNKRGEVENALKYYHKSLKIQEEVGDKKGMAMSYVNIGSMIGYKGENKAEALNYYKKALSIHKEIGNKRGTSNCLSNIAVYYGEIKDYNASIKCLNEALSLNNQLDDKSSQARVLTNLGTSYHHLGQNEKALEKLNESQTILTKYNISEGLAQNHISYAQVYLSQNKLDKAIYHGKVSLELNKKEGYVEKTMRSANLLRLIYAQKKEGLKAYEMYQLYILMKDSLNNIDNLRNLAIQEAEYKYEKKKELDSIKFENEIAIGNEARAKQRIIIYSSIGGLLLVIIFSFFVINRLNVTKKQKSIIEVAHKEIKDSITYAKRIQSAILPPIKFVKEHLKESFILYKPKDVVAGDFYWMECINKELADIGYETEEGGEIDYYETHYSSLILFAVADCTGHGVPGAMVSVVCNNALNRSVREHNLIDPGEILTKTREIVLSEFEKSEEDVKDGMDIALCSIDGSKLQYAGAHNPLWIIRNGELIETKANKQPIGQFDNPEPYTTHNFELEKGDSIYIFSDGYVDQFGGEKGKKFKAKAFRELLLSIQDKSMEEQKTIIDKAFETWRGSLEQVDDVCIIGVRI